jgi:DNA-binding response OmpR family regulator
LIGKALQKDKIDFTSVRVDSRDEFVDALDNFGADVILSDHSLPQFNSIEALKICQAKGMNVPFILVTGAVSEEFAVTCLKKGADDYILKSNLSRLPLAIRYALRQREDEQLRKEQNVKLRLQNIKLKKLNSELDLFVYSTSQPSVTADRHRLINLQARAGSEKHRNTFRISRHDEKSVSKLDETLSYIPVLAKFRLGAIPKDSIEKLLQTSLMRSVTSMGTKRFRKCQRASRSALLLQ